MMKTLVMKMLNVAPFNSRKGFGEPLFVSEGVIRPGWKNRFRTAHQGFKAAVCNFYFSV